jgi:uncharacterized protein (TIGR00299 family) protein
MKLLYFDCFAGIAGDMTVGALLDLGVPFDYLQAELGKLPLSRLSYRLGLERVTRKGLAATRFIVHQEEHQPHRRYTTIAGMIEESGITSRAKDYARRIFFRLAEAEARVHGVEIGNVHFHEVGAVDSIMDIVGAAVCVEYLGIDEFHASPLPLGSGWVDTQHGRMPVPAPATAELLRGMPVQGEAVPGERVTPTGAAIIAALCTQFGPLPTMRLTAVGCGAGTKEFGDTPNVLRLMMGERDEAIAGDDAFVLETNIDDMTPEALGYLMERLFAAGALDVAFSPLQMKKNRPGTLVTVICLPADRERLGRLVLAESTAIGVRTYPVRRMTLAREVRERQTSLGLVRIKTVRVESGARSTPEFDDCRRIALERELPLLEVVRTIERELEPPEVSS